MSGQLHRGDAAACRSVGAPDQGRRHGPPGRRCAPNSHARGALIGRSYLDGVRDSRTAKARLKAAQRADWRGTTNEEERSPDACLKRADAGLAAASGPQRFVVERYAQALLRSACSSSLDGDTCQPLVARPGDCAARRASVQRYTSPTAARPGGLRAPAVATTRPAACCATRAARAHGGQAGQKSARPPPAWRPGDPQVHRRHRARPHRRPGTRATHPARVVASRMPAFRPDRQPGCARAPHRRPAAHDPRAIAAIGGPVVHDLTRTHSTSSTCARSRREAAPVEQRPA